MIAALIGYRTVAIWLTLLTTGGLLSDFAFINQEVTLPLWGLLILVLSPTTKLIELSTSVVTRADKQVSEKQKFNNNENE